MNAVAGSIDMLMYTNSGITVEHGASSSSLNIHPGAFPAVANSAFNSPSFSSGPPSPPSWSQLQVLPNDGPFNPNPGPVAEPEPVDISWTTNGLRMLRAFDPYFPLDAPEPLAASAAGYIYRPNAGEAKFSVLAIHKLNGFHQAILI